MPVQKIEINLQNGSYTVFCGAGAIAKADNYFNAPGAAVIISNKKVWGKLKSKLVLLRYAYRFKEILLPDGEEYKTFSQVEKIIDKLAKLGMRRDGTVIAFGGGVVGDVAGFAAAIYMRGIRLIQIPTTLLAQVDAAVGGKTGVNHKSGKNLIGAFYQPAAVFCDTDFLKTLPKREYCAGLAEVVKYALLGDAKFFSWLEKNAAALMARENTAMQKAIVKSVQMKAAIVAEDERETKGKRAQLNLGHTFAHAVENAAGYGEWLHGEAVAAGLVAAARLSEKLETNESVFTSADTKRIIALLKKFNLPVSFRGIDSEKIRNAMRLDKKFSANKKFFILMHCIGKARVRDTAMDLIEIEEVLEEMT